MSRLGQGNTFGLEYEYKDISNTWHKDIRGTTGKINCNKCDSAVPLMRLIFVWCQMTANTFERRYVTL